MRKALLFFLAFALTTIPQATVLGSATVTELTTGAEMHAPAAVRFDAAGKMYVADTAQRRIVQMDPDTGALLSIHLDASDNVDITSDFDIGADNTFYWVNPLPGQIWKQSPGASSQLLAQLVPPIDGITLCPSGRLFTAGAQTDILYEIDPAGIIPPRIAALTGGLDSFDCDQGDVIYGPDFYGGTGDLYKINPDTGVTTVLASGFAAPISVRLNSLGEVHVMDIGTNEIIKVDKVTGVPTVVAPITPVGDSFAFSPTNQIFIANVGDAYIGKIDSLGSTVFLTEPGFSLPNGISVIPGSASASDQLWVGTGFSVRKFDTASGTELATLYTGSLTDVDENIVALSLDYNGTNLALTNFLFNQVQIWNPSTETNVQRYTNFVLPVNAVFYDNTIAVAQFGTGTVLRADNNLPLMAGLLGPSGMVTNSNKDLWVADRTTGIVWKAVSHGLPLPTPIPVATGLNQPEGLALDNNGHLLVLETGAQRLVRIHKVTGAVSVVATGLDVDYDGSPLGPPTWLAVAGVDVAPDGTIYVSGEKGNVIYEIEE